MLYYKTHPFLYHAKVGLNISANSGMDIIHSKITEYLAAGLKVVTDEGPPNAGDVLALHAGCVTPHGDVGAMLAAVKREGAKVWDRQALQESAWSLGSYESAARIVESYLEH